MGVSSGLESSTSAWASVFNLGNCAIGAGILSFPYAVQRCGLIGGVLVCLLVACVELYTQFVLARQATKHRAITYQGLVMTVLGSRASEVMAWTIFLFLFGSCVAFMIIVGDTFGAVLRQYVIQRFALPPWLAARQIMILVPALTIMLPLSLQRSMGALAGASTVAVVVMMATTVLVIGKCAYAAIAGADGEGHAFLQGVVLFKCDFGTFAALPVMIFAYHCHVQAVPIYFELVDDPRLCGGGCARRRARGTAAAAAPSAEPAAAPQPDSDTIVDVIARKLRGMYAVLAAAYAECTIMYLATGVAGYLLFPQTATSNILNNFSPEDTLMQATRFVVGWAVVLHYPINQHVARSALYDLICRYLNMELREENVPYGHVATMTVLFFIATSTTACVVSDLGIVFQFIGGIAGSLLIFILPGALIVADRRRPAAAAPPAEAEPRASTSTAAAAAADLDVPILWGDAADSLSTDWRSRQAHQRSGAARRGDVRASTSYGLYGTLLDEKACYESAWDTLAGGWALVIAGACVIVLTLTTAVAALLEARRGAGFHDSFLESGAAAHERSQQALSVVLAA